MTPFPRLAAAQARLASVLNAAAKPVRYKFWIDSADEKVCKRCQAISRNNPDGVPTNEGFKNADGQMSGLMRPPAHPNCRCSLDYRMVTK